MSHSEASFDAPPNEVGELSAQVKLLALNTAIEASAPTQDEADTTLRLAALNRLLEEIQTAVSRRPVEATAAEATGGVEAAEDEAPGRKLAKLAQRLDQAVAAIDA